MERISWLRLDLNLSCLTMWLGLYFLTHSFDMPYAWNILIESWSWSLWLCGQKLYSFKYSIDTPLYMHICARYNNAQRKGRHPKWNAKWSFLYNGHVSVKYQAIVDWELGKCSRWVWCTKSWVAHTLYWVELWPDWVAFTPGIKYNMLKMTTLKDLWEKFDSIYASNSLTNWFWLNIELYDSKWRWEEICDHTNLFTKLVCQLLNTDVKAFIGRCWHCLLYYLGLMRLC